MTQKEALQEYEELTYDLAKVVGKLDSIRQRMKYINAKMSYDGMFELDFDNAMVSLANVQAAAICYTLEEKYRDRDIKQYRDEANALEKS